MLICLISGQCFEAGGYCAVRWCDVLVVKHGVACIGCGLLPPLKDAHRAVKGVVQAKAVVHLGKQGILDAHDCQVDCRQQGSDLQWRQQKTLLKRGSDKKGCFLLGTSLQHGMATTGQHMSHEAMRLRGELQLLPMPVSQLLP